MSLSSRWNRVESESNRRHRPAETRRKRKPLALGLLVELLERRDAPATYAWDGAGNLSVVLGSAETVTVSQAPGTTKFVLSGGTDVFTSTGASTATGSGTATTLRV